MCVFVLLPLLCLSSAHYIDQGDFADWIAFPIIYSHGGN